MADLPAAKKSLGQHWLQDTSALQAMVQAAHVSANDTVLEIGPGFGTLTAQLLASGARVLALEFDETLVPALRQKFSNYDDKFNVELGDIRQFDLTQLPADYKIVANIPYYLTSNLIQLLSESANPPSVAALLVQKEVAERVVAGPGAMSLLSVTAQYYWATSVDLVVPARLFSPPPKVDSQILVLQRRPQLALDHTEVKKFFQLVKAGYSQRRKTLLNSLSGGLQLAKPEVKELCHTAGIDASRRAQTLSISEWLQLYKVLVERSPTA